MHIGVYVSTVTRDPCGSLQEGGAQVQGPTICPLNLQLQTSYLSLKK